MPKRPPVKKEKPIQDPDPPKAIFARNLRAILDASGFTQTDFAALVGTNNGTVNRWVTGVSMPRGPRYAFVEELLNERLGVPYGTLSSSQGLSEREIKQLNERSMAFEGSSAYTQAHEHGASRTGDFSRVEGLSVKAILPGDIPPTVGTTPAEALAALRKWTAPFWAADAPIPLTLMAKWIDVLERVCVARVPEVAPTDPFRECGDAG